MTRAATRRQETGSLTVLRELGGAGKRGDLEAVLGDGDGSGVVERLPCLKLRPLHLRPGGRQPQVHPRVLRLFGVGLRDCEQTETLEGIPW